MQELKLCCPETYGPDFREGHDMGRREAHRDSIRRLGATLKLTSPELVLPRLDHLDFDQLDQLFELLLRQLTARLDLSLWLQKQSTR
jgi:hypothetical protein